jgi:arabinogalactan oligomer/maltooligosaccharide transport system permease protein
MFFVTGPYLLTSFTGNLNNFNVIYLLTGGGPDKVKPTKFGSVGNTDLLITWLFDLTNANSNYRLSSVIGILIFVVVAFLSLIVYNLLPSNRNEEDFS